MATYTKLKSGAWGARIDGPAPAVGSVISVTRRDGAAKQHVVAAVVWRGGGVVLVALAQERTHARTGTTPQRGGGCNYCGSPYCPGRYGELCDQD